MKKTYEAALKLLESRHRRARPKTKPAVHHAAQSLPQMQGSPSFRGQPSIAGMRNWLQLLGHSDDDLDAMNVIHVAGTKGKGSTCAFARALLAAHAARSGFPATIGLYTSPELTCVRERIQIGNRPISEALFTKYFFEVWDCLAAAVDPMPRFLQLLALVAFHTFIRERTAATIIETHNGGQYDATNIVRSPAATAITPVAMDHVAQLGPTLADIAWHKAGIMKRGTPAFSSPQDPVVADLLQRRAAELEAPLVFVNEPSIALPVDSPNMRVPAQRSNASTAIALTRAFLDSRAPAADDKMLTDDDVAHGIATFNWPGRFQTVGESQLTWYLDGAHNELSIAQAARWFADCNTKRDPFALIFSHFNESRDGLELMRCLAAALAEAECMPSHVVFTTYQERRDGSTRPDKTTRPPEQPFPDLLPMYVDAWAQLDHDRNTTTVCSEDSIEAALDRVRGLNVSACFITGSLHLVGGALGCLQAIET